MLRALERKYGTPRHGNVRDVFWETVYILLSIRTTERAYRAVFRDLRDAYRTMDDVATAPTRSLKRLLAPLGLSGKRAGQLKAIAHALVISFGTRRALNRFGRERPKDLEKLLQTFPGVGIKVAKCVVMYACDSAVLPVDVHVWRVASRLGLAPGGRIVDERARELERRVAPRFRYDFHVRAMALGRDTCGAVPDCGRCVLRRSCPSARSATKGTRAVASR